MRKLSFILFLLVTMSGLTAQQAISLENIWQTYDFIPGSVRGFNFLQDGTSFTRLNGNEIVRYNLATGATMGVILNGADLPQENGWTGEIESYTFSEDETKILLSTDSRQSFRHSSEAYFFVYDRESRELTPVNREKRHRLASLNQAADKVAYVMDNNLFYKDLTNGDVVQITKDGKTNSIINGATDWVYEEEFSFDRGFQWSPDGQRIAFYRFDESAVPEFTYTDFKDGLYPVYNTFKYPKVGEANSEVSIHVHHLAEGKTEKLLSVNDANSGEWHYVPRIQWTNDPAQLAVTRMNRHQSLLELLAINTKTGKRSTLVKEGSKYYVDVTDNLTFLKNGKQFIWSSEKDGHHHLYLYSMDGRQLLQLTSGNYDVTDFYGVDEANKRIYFQAAAKDPMQREVYSKSLAGKDKPQPIADQLGSSSANFSSTFDYFVLNHSTINTPPTYRVMDRDGKEVRSIIDNESLAAKQAAFGVQPVEFFSFETSEGVNLNGYIIKPEGASSGRKHPLLMHVYGGPGSQQVRDNWRGQNYWWFQMLVQQGFAVAVVDNRGTGARGEEFKKMTYLELGKYETIDQIEAAQFLGGKNYIDEDRIAIFGWSYGGFMALHGILQGNDVFAAAISVAPVTSWKWYDTIYTERYMRTLAENRDGYEKNSPVYYADRLKGDLLLVHGMGDDNVHFQHTAEMANALIMANKQFDTYFYPNRNHGIYGGPTRLHLYTKMTDFLLTSIGPKASRKNRPVSLEVERGRE
ncbi:MAG: alpha/beta fold hydrolase [Bacteroidota bacterium]